MIKYDNSFTKQYKEFYNQYILQKILLKKLIFVIRYLFKKESIIKKILFSRFINYKLNFNKLKNNERFLLKNSKPFVSIIIPTFNSQKTIKKTIRSILNQTYKNFEIIIIDNSETDETVKIIKKILA